MPSEDVERLKLDRSSRSRCLDTCLLCSVAMLFVMVLSGAVAAMVLLKELRGKIAVEGDTSALQERQLLHGSSYKMQNFAFLQVLHSELTNSTMHWGEISFGQGKSVGSRYHFQTDKQALQVLQEGTYFLYIDLSLTCTYKCPAGQLRVYFYDDFNNEKLSCTIAFAETDSKPVTKKCWVVLPHLEKGSRLLAQMIVPVGGLPHWKLDRDASGFGMFLVDGPGV